MTTFRIIGPGRAGRSLMAALDATGDFVSRGALGRDDRLTDAAAGVDLLVIATPDDEVRRVAAAVAPDDTTVVIHLSGSLGLGALEPHFRRGSVHPLVPLPSPETGADRLRSGITFAVSGDPMAGAVVAALGGRAFAVGDPQRTGYHATASIAANHLVALVGQVERVAASVGLPLDAFSGLMHAALDDAFDVGPRRALTGPASRGDWGTVEQHRRALSALAGPRTELAAYDAMVGLARRLSLEEQPKGVGEAQPAGVPSGPAVPVGTEQVA